MYTLHYVQTVYNIHMLHDFQSVIVTCVIDHCAQVQNTLLVHVMFSHGRDVQVDNFLSIYMK